MMDRKRGGAHAELTCAAGDRAGAGAWVFVGDSAGRVLALPRLQPAAESAWSVDVCASAITSLCVLAERGRAEPLVVAGSADGELVFLRADLELRRLRLASAVRCVAHLRGGRFLAGDLGGALYCVTRHEVLGTEVLPNARRRPCGGDKEAAAALFPGASEPLVAAIAPVKLLDVQQVESSYALVSAAQRALLLTHRGRVVASVRTRSPLTTVACGGPAGVPAEDVVLAAGEEGVVYRLASARSSSTPERPDLQLVLEPWASTIFPVAKLLIVSGLDTEKNDAAALTWLAVGPYGQSALFRGRELAKQQSAPTATTGGELLVDALLLSGPDKARGVVATVALVFPGGVRRVELSL